MLKGALAGATALSFKEGPLEENKVADSYRDASICKVEDWAEKDKVLPTPDWHPRGQLRIYYWKVEHIYHLAKENGRITSSRWKEGCRLKWSGLAKEETVKEAVKHIPNSAYKD